MTPPRKKQLSDTDEALAVVVGEASAQKVLDELTPTMGAPMHGESSEHLRLIARDVVSSHERDCHGLQRLERWTGEMQKTVKDHGDVISQYLGEQKFKRFVMPILIGALGSAAGVAIMGLLFKGLLVAIAKASP